VAAARARALLISEVICTDVKVCARGSGRVVRFGAFEGSVDGGASDGKEFHQVGDGVLTGAAHADQLGLLPGRQLR
jgi:hypothetical protein